VTERLTALGTNAEDATWDSIKRNDGSWQVQLVFAADGRSRTAGWVYDPRRKHATPADDEAARLSLPEADLPPLPAPSGMVRGEATVTQLQPRIAPSGQPARPVRRQAEAPAAHHQAEAPAPQRQAEAPAAHHRAEAPVARRQAEAPAPQRQAEAPAARRQAEAPAAHHQAEAPVVQRQAEAPAARRKGEASTRRSPEGPLRRQEQPAPVPAPPPVERAERARRTERAPVAQQAPEQEVEQPAAAEQADAAPQEERAPAAQNGRRAAGGRGRRSSVPSWDEIMFGSSRPRE
jgi:Protein of unknown function (DUF3071)